MDTFSLLASGVKFDRSRFAADINRFQPKQNKAAEAQRGAAQQPPHAQAQAHAGQARKRKRGSAHQQDQGPGIDVFTKSKVNQQQPGDQETDEEEVESDEGPSTSDEEQEPEGDDSSEPLAESEDEEGELSEDDLQGPGHRHTGHGRHSGGRSSGIDPGCPVVATRDIQEAANVVRKHYRIKIAGTDPPAPLRSWHELPASAGAVAAAAARLKQTSASQAADGQAGGDGLAGEEEEEGARHAQRAAEKLVGRLVDALMASEPTPIQRQAIPCLLEGRELLAVAPTGSGKTLAFLVPLLLRLKALSRVEGKPGDGGQPGPRALLLSPTHELAAQQARVLRLLLPGSGLKGALLTKATATDNACTKIDILLANPLRVANMVAAKQLDLSRVRHLILDEADKLFDMGFVTQIDAILAACTHPDITRALFSATLPDKVEQLARSVLSDPLRVTVGARNTAVSSVKQRLLFVGRGEAGKLLALRQLLAAGLNPPVLVFVATKERAKALHRELLYDGVRVDSINAAQSHTVRAAAVDNFRSGRTWMLVATDLVGRGMDFIGVRTVVNFDVPSSTSDYIHRVGRTGRAHQTGEAVTFFTEEDAPLLRPIANLVKEAGGEVPEWMLTMKKLRTKDRRRHRLPDAVAAGATLSTRPSYDLKKKRLKQQGIQARQLAKQVPSGKEQRGKQLQGKQHAQVNGKQIRNPQKAKQHSGQLQNGQRGPGPQKDKQRSKVAQANGSAQQPAAANGGAAARQPPKGQARPPAGAGEAGGSAVGGRHKRPKLNQA